MAQISPYKIFWDWVYDRKPDSKIPSPSDEIPDILKYNSPITHTFLLKSFINNAVFNKYLNDNMNNMGIRYIEKDDLFKFFKQAVADFKVKRSSIYYTQYARRNMLYEKTRKKFPLLKNEDISFLCDVIDRSKNKDAIYSAFDIKKAKKEKLSTKKKAAKKISSKNFLATHFNMMEVKN